MFIFHLSILHSSAWNLINICTEKHSCPQTLDQSRAGGIWSLTFYAGVMCWMCQHLMTIDHAMEIMEERLVLYTSLLLTSSPTSWNSLWQDHQGNDWMSYHLKTLNVRTWPEEISNQLTITEKEHILSSRPKTLKLYDNRL